MASISAGNGQSGKRALDHEIPLVPFIDLLLCCVMFLLVTAVWNQLASLPATMSLGTADQPTGDQLSLWVRLESSRFVVSSNIGDRTEIGFSEGEPDFEALGEHLRAERPGTSGHLVISADDSISYHQVIGVMDMAMATGFRDVTMGDTPPM